MIGLNSQKILDAMFSCYKFLYLISEPKAKFEDIYNSEEIKKEGWYLKYYIPEDVLDIVLDMWAKAHKLKRIDRELFMNSMYLGSVPTSDREVWRKANNGKCTCSKE